MEKESDAVPIKKQKMDEESGDTMKSPPTLENFDGVTIEKVLSENAKSKMITIHGKIGGEDAVVLLEKTPFVADKLGAYITEKTVLKNTLKNDIYGTYEAYPPPAENTMKAVVIHPATEKHLAKYSYQETFVVEETEQLYRDVTLPTLQEKQFSMQWVYNILEKKQEADRIVYEDPDPDTGFILLKGFIWVYNILEKKQEADRIVYEDPDPDTGFILLPDMKWDRKDVEALYLVAIVHKHGLKSLRDLNTDTLPLLRNIREKGLRAIQEKYGVPASKLFVYLHYQPSYYHLHVHFTHLKLEAGGFGADRAHLLTDVIQNLERDSEYYVHKTLTYCVREQDHLYKAYKKAGYFDGDKTETPSKDDE